MRKRKNENQKIKGKTTATQTITFKSRKSPKDKRIGKGKPMTERKYWKLWSRVFSVIFIGTLLVGTIAIIVFFDTVKNLPDLDVEKVLTPVNSVVIDKAGNEVADLAEASSVIIENYEDVPQSLIDGFTATEDSRFFRHHGIDGPRTVQAVLGTYIFRSGDSGGSTITQQLVKQTLLADKIATNEGYKNSVQRKIDEWILAFLLEKKLSKDEIFLSYLNNGISYGRFTGAGTAAKRYFNKQISQLTVPEAALLAGIPQLPIENNPYYDIEAATARYNVVLDSMLRHNFISAEEADAARNIPLADIVIRNQESFINENAAYFTAVENELKTLFKDQETDEGAPIYYQNYRIYTELVPEQQAFANQIMESEDYVNWTGAARAVYGSEMSEDDNFNFQGAFTVVDVKTGGIPAIGASRNIRKSGYNIAVEGYRSPGSSIKPIIDYTPAVEKFGWGAYHLMNDRVTYYSGTNSQVYNYNQGGHSGLVTMADAIGDSKNTTAVQAIQLVGLEDAAIISTNMGISKAWPLYQQGLLGESAALGGGLEVTTKELAGAYATLASGGVHHPPHTITKVENIKTGEVIWEYQPAQQDKQVVSQSTSATMTDALIHSRRTGTMASGARKQVSYSIPFAAKTGTSSYSEEEIRNYGVSRYSEKDHWHVGYSPTYAIASWTGLAVEGEDVLTRTGGNVNANRSVGSYVLASWMNQFGDDGATFDFLGASNKDARGSIGDFSIHVDNNAKRIDWTMPALHLPTGFSDADRETIGGITFTVTFTTSSGTWTMETQGTSLAFPTTPFDTGSVTITAKLNNDKSDTLVDGNTQTVSGLVNRQEQQSSNNNNEDEEESSRNNNRNTQNAGANERTNIATAILQIIHQLTSFNW